MASLCFFRDSACIFNSSWRSLIVMKVDILCVYVQPILAQVISDNVNAVIVFLVRYMHKLSISSVSSYLRHDISGLRLPKRSSIRGHP